ncbi:MAG: SGNH/GDSL hydrolase family protein, partial [Bacteroidales bacterium]|nr:SGNH/GDSL hydrolase family protein [Bacteroidales bacterium]
MQEGKNVNTYLEDIPADSVNLRIMSITRNKVSSATGQNYWNLVFYINTPLYETRDGKNYIIRDAEGNVQYTKDSNLFFTLSEEKNGVIDETLTLTNVLYEENGVEYKSFNYKLKLYAVIDWELMTQGTIINFYPRNVLQSAYDINSSPQIKEYIKEKESSLPIKIEAKATFNLTPENRIALYGASLCSDSYPWFKEWLERYTGAEVLNAGNPGWNAKQLASTDYYNKIKSLDADIIYVMFGGNDKGDNVGTFGAVSSQPLVEEIPLSEEWSNSEAGSKDYLFIQSLDYVLRKLKSEYYNVNNSIKEDKRFPYIVVGTFPSQHREGWQFTEYNNPQNWLNKRNAIVECANKNNLPCIDMFSELGIDWDKEPYYNQDFDYNTATGTPTLVNRGIYTLDGLHLNEWGFQRMANLLSGALLPSNSGVKEIKLNPSFNLNNYKTQGLYYLNGERISSNDNLPIMNMGNVSGQITILDANGCVTQYLKLTNAGGSEGKEYVRTFANGGWSRWSELKQTIYLGQTSDDNLKYIVDNGHYEGAILNLNDLAGGTNIFATYLQAFLDTIPNVGYDRLISGSLFSIDVLNNYAVVKEAESWGRIFERSVTQIAKV